MHRLTAVCCVQAWADYAKTRSARHKLLKFLREHDEPGNPAPGEVSLSCSFERLPVLEAVDIWEEQQPQADEAGLSPMLSSSLTSPPHCCSRSSMQAEQVIHFKQQMPVEWRWGCLPAHLMAAVCVGAGQNQRTCRVCTAGAAEPCHSGRLG